jgi:hypothetical protein
VEMVVLETRGCSVDPMYTTNEKLLAFCREIRLM